MRIPSFFAATLLLVASCSSQKEPASLGDYHTEFLIYRLSALDSMLTCEATFQKGGKDKRASALPEGYSVELDGVPLPSDGDEFPTYSVEKQEGSFAGTHTWTVKNKTGVVLQKTVSYQPLKLISPVPAVIKKEDVVLTFENATDSITLECYFSKNDLQHLYCPVKNNKAVIPQADVAKVPKETQTLYLTGIYKSALLLNGKEIGIAEVQYPLHSDEVTVK
jgi:hypothetical protein